MTTNVLLWTTHAPNPLTNALEAAGYRVWEVLAISEVTYLCESQDIAVVVIAAGIEDRRCAELQRHRVTIKLEPNATAAEVIRMLWECFPGAGHVVQ